MDNFWSKLLILGVVAAIGLFFVGNVYAPQKEAQSTMAESTQMSVEAVKAGVEDTAPAVVKGDMVISTVNQYCKSGSTVSVVVKKTTGATYTYTTTTTSSSYVAPAAGNLSVSSVADLAKYYSRTVAKSGTTITSITFVEQ